MGRWNGWPGRLLHLAGAGALIALPGTAGQAAVLQPTGKWVLDFADGMCVLTRAFGSADKAVSVAFRPWPLDGRTQLIVESPRRSVDDPTIGDGLVRIGAHGRLEHHRYTIWPSADGKRTIATVNVDQAALDALADGDTIEVAAGGPPVTFAPIGMAHAHTVMADCQDDLLKSWGVDPAAEALATTPAHSRIGNRWISETDYPKGALRQGNIGLTTLLYRVGSDGRASDCRVVGSSGTPQLDQSACTALVANGRFAPALDATGAPIASHRTAHIDWRLD